LLQRVPVRVSDICPDTNVADGSNIIETENDLRLVLGAQIARSARDAVLRELKYTCSAGIAHNKLLAKVYIVI